MKPALLAAGFLLLQALTIFLEGWITLLIYRQGALHRAWERPAGWLRDLIRGLPVTWCGCMTQGIAYAIQKEPSRAARFLLRSVSLRATLLVGLGAVGAPLWMGLLWLAWVEVGVWWLGRRELLSSGALFLQRRSGEPVADALGDAWRESREMYSVYGLFLVAGALAGAAAWGWPVPTLAPGLWTLLGLVVSLLPVDLLVLLPLLGALSLGGAPLLFLVPAMVGVELGSRRSRRVAHALLKAGRERDWDRWMRLPAPILALLLWIAQ